MLAIWSFLAAVASARTCVNVTIPFELNARLASFNEIPVEGNLDTTAFAQEITKSSGNFTQALLKDYATVTGNYSISAKYCRPDSGHSSVVQVLSHGIGFDKT